MLIKAGASKEDAVKVVQENGWLKAEHVESLLNKISVEKALNWLNTDLRIHLTEDACVMLKQFPNLEVGKEIKGISHLHDVLSYMSNHLEDADAELWHHPEFCLYEGHKIQDYTVRFPQKLSDLKYWGAHLGICVGSYGSRVHSGESIVFALYKEDKPCVCVEIAGKDHSLNQVYGKHNSQQPKELSKAIKDLMLRSNKRSLVDTSREMNLEYKEFDCKTLYKEAVYHVNQRALQDAEYAQFGLPIRGLF